jgi:hypothetical protein
MSGYIVQLDFKPAVSTVLNKILSTLGELKTTRTHMDGEMARQLQRVAYDSSMAATSMKVSLRYMQAMVADVGAALAGHAQAAVCSVLYQYCCMSCVVLLIMWCGA